MVNVAKLASRLNWRRAPHAHLPRFFLFSDEVRLADPLKLLSRLPRGAALVLRHTDPAQLEALATRIKAPAHALGLKVLISGDVRLAIKLKCDGVHLSQRTAKRGPLRIQGFRPDFLISAAAHDGLSLRRATRAGCALVMLSPVFATDSHPKAKPLGLLRFSRMAGNSDGNVIGLGGITPAYAKRLSLSPAFGIAAIGAWRL